MLSGLPIEYEDKVVLFLLKPRFSEAHIARTYYATDNYRPLYPAIYGDYNEYGSIENIQYDAELIPYLNHLNLIYDTDVALTLTTRKEAKEEDLKAIKAFSADKANFEAEISEWISDLDNRSYYVKDESDKECILDRVFILRDVYEYMMEAMGSRMPYEEGKTLRQLIGDKMDKQMADA